MCPPCLIWNAGFPPEKCHHENDGTSPIGIKAGSRSALFGSTLHCPECRTALAVSENWFFAQSYSTLLPGLWAVKRTGAWQRPAGLSPPEDLSSCPHCLRLWLDRLFFPGRRDHCKAGCHACFWLGEYRSAPSLPFVYAEGFFGAGGPGAPAASLFPLVRGPSAVVVRHRIWPYGSRLFSSFTQDPCYPVT